MKRTVRSIAAAGAAAALVAMAAPAAHAQDCTTVYVNTLTRSSAPQYVTYTPPADVDVNGNALIGYISFVAGATGAYVDCVV